MSTANQTDDRRRFTRVAFDAESELCVDGANQPVQLVDISLRGFLINEPEGFAGTDDADYRLLVHLVPGEVELSLPGTLAWRRPPHLGFACGDLELETVSHLRRLVELNLGDQSLLDRELEHLLGE